MTGSDVLRLDAVGKEYPGPPVTRALSEVTFSVRTGEYVGVVGPSGSGKSTLLNLVGALDRPSEGRIVIDGHDTSTVSDRQLSAVRCRSIGFVFQSFNLVDGLDAVDNVALGLLYAGESTASRRRRAMTALERVGLSHRSDHRPSRLSGGERQRVAIARALVSDPALLLADEPTGNLDTQNGDAVLELFDELHREGATIVLITHDPQVAGRLPRTVAIRDGHVCSDVTAAPTAAEVSA